MKLAQKAFRPKIPNLQNSEKSQPDFLDRNEQRQLQRRPQPRPEQGLQEHDKEHTRTDEEFATTFSVFRNKERQLVCRT